MDLIRFNIKDEPPVELDLDNPPEEYENRDYKFIETSQLTLNHIAFLYLQASLASVQTTSEWISSHGGSQLMLMPNNESSGFNSDDHLFLETEVKPRQHRCDQCGIVFNRKILLQNHIEIKHRKSTAKFKCKECQTSFDLLIHLEEHQQRHNTNRSFECILCSHTYKRLPNLKSHLKNHWSIYTDYYHTNEEELVTQSHNTDSPSKPYKCKLCGRQYSLNNSLIRHLKMHYSPKSCRCEVCGKIYHRGDHLKEHLLTHNKDINIKCKVCGIISATQISHNRHITLHDLKLKCKVCGIISATRICHNRHIKLHDNVVPAPTKISSKPLYTCAYCGQEFVRKYSWRRHSDAHETPTNNQCVDCGKTFHRPYYLNQHRLIHSNGERPYKCDICGKSTNHKSSLQKHIFLMHIKKQNQKKILEK